MRFRNSQETIAQKTHWKPNRNPNRTFLIWGNPKKEFFQLIVDPDFFTHWKTQMLIDTLDDAAAPLYVLRLWAHCQNRKQTSFDNLPDVAIKTLCRYRGHPEKLVKALVESGFCSRKDGNSLEIVGWAEHNKKLVANWDNGKKGGRPKKSTSEGNARQPETHSKPKSENSELGSLDKIGVDKSLLVVGGVGESDSAEKHPLDVESSDTSKQQPTLEQVTWFFEQQCSSTWHLCPKKFHANYASNFWVDKNGRNFDWRQRAISFNLDPPTYFLPDSHPLLEARKNNNRSRKGSQTTAEKLTAAQKAERELF